MRVSIPYLKLRNGRPRWEPGPALRKSGWKGRNLQYDDGAWMNTGDAMIAAQQINSEVDVWRAGGRKRRKTPVPQRPAHCCQALFEKWYDSQDFKRLAPKTRHDYQGKARIFLELFGDHHVKAITKPQLVAFWERCYASRGHHMANGIKAVVSSALTYAELIGWRHEQSNPALRMKRPKAPERVVLWLPAELDAFVAAADAAGLHSAADALIVALHSGQRLGDVITMPPRIFDETRIRLSQLKTKALIDAPMTPACLARVEAIRSRQRAAALISIEALILNEKSGRPHTVNSLNKMFCKIRKEVAADIPTIAGKRFQDLRDTAVTRLALAECTMPEIAAITGHSLQSITQVMKHYLALQPEMADAAIDKLNTWMQTQKIEI